MPLKEFTSALAGNGYGEGQLTFVGRVRRLGFEPYAATVAVDSACGEPFFSCVDNTPSVHNEIFGDHSIGRLDPVAQHCKKSNAPIVWNQSTYVSAGWGEQWETQAQFGYGSGVHNAAQKLGLRMGPIQ